DPSADAAMTDLGVHRIREVDRSRAGGQREHIALRAEHEDLLHREVIAQRLQKLARVSGLALPVEQLTHPCHVVDLGGRAAVWYTVAALGLFVAPVRCNSILRGAVHVAGSDLDLQGL